MTEWSLACVCVAGLAVMAAPAALADVELGVSRFAGEAGYRAHEVDAAWSPRSGKMRVNAGYFASRLNGVVDFRESRAGIDSQGAGVFGWGASGSTQVTDFLKINTLAPRVSFKIGGSRERPTGTVLDLGLQRAVFRPRDMPASDSLIQNGYRIGVSQEIGRRLSLYTAYDRYHYRTRPTLMAQLLRQRSIFAPTLAEQLLILPESSWMAGAGWHAMPALSFDFNFTAIHAASGIDDSRMISASARYHFTQRQFLGVGYSRTVPESGAASGTGSLSYGIALD